MQQCVRCETATVLDWGVTMAAKRVFIDDVEFHPLEGEELHLTIISGGERLPFCISRAGALKAAYGAISTVSVAAKEALVVPFRSGPPGQH